MKIDMNKKYRRVGTHEPVRVICVDRKAGIGVTWCVGLYQSSFSPTEEVIHFDTYGYSPGGMQVIEEVPAVDWSKVEVDTLIWVYNTPKYFANYHGGLVYYFKSGATSKTSLEGVGFAYPENCSVEKVK